MKGDCHEDRSNHRQVLECGCFVCAFPSWLFLQLGERISCAGYSLSRVFSSYYADRARRLQSSNVRHLEIQFNDPLQLKFLQYRSTVPSAHARLNAEPHHVSFGLYTAGF